MATTQVQTFPVISFDLGNRFNAITDGKKIINFPSVLEDTFATQSYDYTAEEYVEHESFKVVIEGEAYEVGKVASTSNGVPTFGTDKWQFIKPFLFAGITGLTKKTNIKIDQLRTAVPNDTVAKQITPIKALENKTFTFSVNDVDYKLTIGEVRVYAEGQFAWMGAIKDKLYAYPKAQNAVLDLGGGTAILRMFAANGAVQRKYEKVLSNGTCSLASAIATSLGRDGIESQILDAIADGSFKTVAGLTFKAEFDKQFDIWLKKIRAEMKTKWQSINDQYGQILVVGGSAPLLTAFAKDNQRYIIAPNPQFFALENMQKA